MSNPSLILVVDFKGVPPHTGTCIKTLLMSMSHEVRSEPNTLADAIT